MNFWLYVCNLFQITPMTLWRWCKRSGVRPHQDPSDQRRRYLDNDQLLRLARLHNRVLIVDTDSVQLSAIEFLEARIAKLESKASQQ
jgi:hypothetical protein